MVFVLEDIAKIETDRQIHAKLTEAKEHTQTGTDILKDPDTASVINSILEPYVNVADVYVWGDSMIGVLGVFTDAFLNAGMWGNRDTPDKKITVTLKYGFLGSVIYVEDEGEGFDYLSQIHKLQTDESHDFSHNGGGMKKFHESNLQIAYHGRGNLISIASPVFTLDETIDYSSRPKE